MVVVAPNSVAVRPYDKYLLFRSWRSSGRVNLHQVLITDLFLTHRTL